MRNYREYDFWKDAMDLTQRVFQITEGFSKNNCLVNQLQRASTSIPSNIAEGASRTSQHDFARFLEISLGSAYETETQVEIAFSLGYITQKDRDELIKDLQSIERRITSFILTLRNKTPKSKS